ncbi:MAG: winged helix-turn-helix domain-containing protein, partial [Prevotella sp.]|nr:winged helix-turn-helix domain-containing protein [Prevotella sp.]
RALNEKGPLSFEDLQRETLLDSESVCTAIGWLAREDKICFDEQNGIRKRSRNAEMPRSTL